MTRETCDDNSELDAIPEAGGTLGAVRVSGFDLSVESRCDIRENMPHQVHERNVGRSGPIQHVVVRDWILRTLDMSG